MGLVVFCGLAFNLVPLCEPGRPARDLARAAIIVVLVFVVVFLLAIGSAWLYGVDRKPHAADDASPRALGTEHDLPVALEVAGIETIRRSARLIRAKAVSSSSAGL